MIPAIMNGRRLMKLSLIICQVPVLGVATYTIAMIITSKMNLFLLNFVTSSSPFYNSNLILRKMKLK